MGNWCMVIQGVGSHHNSGRAGDADILLAEFVDELKAVGQQVTHASITFGAAQAESTLNPYASPLTRPAPAPEPEPAVEDAPADPPGA